MKNYSTNRFLPYEADYELLSKFRRLETIGLWLMAIFSIAFPFFNYFSDNTTDNKFNDIANFLYFIILIGYYVIDLYTEIFLYPATARKRRKGFIDNSLGSKFLEKDTKNYYSNDEINVGPYKILVNCCENCFFTLNIARAMLPAIVLKNMVLFIVALTIAYFGIINNLIAIPILQILLSSLFFSELVHSVNFVAKLNQLFEKFKDVFVNIKDNSLLLQQAVLLYVEYETILAYNKSPLSDTVYKKLNQKLTNEWEEIKERYEISQ